MAKLGQRKSGTLRVNDPTKTGDYGIVYADEIIGHRRVDSFDKLLDLPVWSLYNKAGGDDPSTAVGQLWYVSTGDTSGHSAGLYQLIASDYTKAASWKYFKNGSDVSDKNTTYTFTDGTNGSFSVKPSDGAVQKISIGKPANATHADTADSATSATSAKNAEYATNAGNATKATNDGNGRNIVNTYATKSEISALTSAMVYRGTVDGTHALPTSGVKIGDVYVVAAAGTYAGQVCENGDMIIAQTTTPTWTIVQTNINGAVTAANNLDDSKFVLGSSNKTVKSWAPSTNGFVKVTNGVPSVDTNKYVTTVNGLGNTDAFVYGDGKDGLKVNGAANGFVKVSSGIVNFDNNTYLTSVPAATMTVKGGGKVTTTPIDMSKKIYRDDDGNNGGHFGVKISKADEFFVDVNIANGTTPGLSQANFTAAEKTKLGNAITSIADASSNTKGIVKLGSDTKLSSTAAKTYPVQNDENGRLRVSVPWVDTNTDTKYTASAPLTLTGTTFGIPAASSAVNGYMSATDKKKLDRMNDVNTIHLSEIDNCACTDINALVTLLANNNNVYDVYVRELAAKMEVTLDSIGHAIVQTVTTHKPLDTKTWTFADTSDSHEDGILFTYQRYYPISGTYSDDIKNKWTAWSIIDTNTIYSTTKGSDTNALMNHNGKTIHTSVSESNGKITILAINTGGITKKGINTEGVTLERIDDTYINTLFNK